MEDITRRPPKKPPPNIYLTEMRMLASIYYIILELIGMEHAEVGGMLTSCTHDYVITGFILDRKGTNTPTSYQPNAKFLNQYLIGRNSEYAGIAHSHKKGILSPSKQDLKAAWSNLTSPANPHLNAFLMPIVQTIPDTGKFEIIPWIIICHPEGMGRVIVRRVPLQIIG